MAEEENVIILKSEQLVRNAEYQTLRLKKIVEGKTKYGDVLYMTFQAEEFKPFRSSYPIGKGERGKLAHFFRAARAFLDLTEDEDVDVSLLTDKLLVYERVYMDCTFSGQRPYYFVVAGKEQQKKAGGN